MKYVLAISVLLVGSAIGAEPDKKEPVAADTFVMKDGSKREGKLTMTTDKEYWIKDKDGQLVKLPKESVQEVIKAEPSPAKEEPAKTAPAEPAKEPACKTCNDTKQVQCAKCNGTGIVQTACLNCKGGRKPCIDCHGRGTFGKNVCMACNGSGKFICNLCKNGFVDAQCPDCKGTKVKDCPDCVKPPEKKKGGKTVPAKPVAPVEPDKEKSGE